MLFKDTYNREYLKHYQELAETELGIQIYQARWKLIEQYCQGHMTLLDYGSGPGSFGKQSTNGFLITNYDINPFSGFDKYPDGEFDILTMWDSIEHLEIPLEPIRNHIPEWIFITTPNLDMCTGNDWRHYKPNEHISLFTPSQLCMDISQEGYILREFNFKEGFLRNPNRPKDIFTMVFKRAN